VKSGQIIMYPNQDWLQHVNKFIPHGTLHTNGPDTTTRMMNVASSKRAKGGLIMSCLAAWIVRSQTKGALLEWSFMCRTKYSCLVCRKGYPTSLSVISSVTACLKLLWHRVAQSVRYLAQTPEAPGLKTAWCAPMLCPLERHFTWLSLLHSGLNE